MNELKNFNSACEERDFSKVKQILQESSEILLRSQDEEGMTILHMALGSSSFQIIEEVLKRIPSNDKLLNQADKYGSSPIHFMSVGSNLSVSDFSKVLEILSQKKGFIANPASRHGETPLRQLCSQGDEKLEFLKCFLEKVGNSINLKENPPNSAYTILGYCCRNIAHELYPKVIEVLLKQKGVDIHKLYSADKNILSVIESMRTPLGRLIDQSRFVGLDSPAEVIKLLILAAIQRDELPKLLEPLGKNARNRRVTVGQNKTRLLGDIIDEVQNSFNNNRAKSSLKAIYPNSESIFTHKSNDGAIEILWSNAELELLHTTDEDKITWNEKVELLSQLKMGDTLSAVELSGLKSYFTLCQQDVDDTYNSTEKLPDNLYSKAGNFIAEALHVIDDAIEVSGKEVSGAALPSRVSMY